MAVMDDTHTFDEKTDRRLLSLPAEITKTEPALPHIAILDEITLQRQSDIQNEISERNARFFVGRSKNT
jgi:hypothetical protein